MVGGVVDEVAAWSVRTQSAARVVGAAQVSLVLGVARDRPQLGDAVRKLTTLGVPALRHRQRERERERYCKVLTPITTRIARKGGA